MESKNRNLMQETMRLRREEEVERSETYKEDSRERLVRSLEKKFKTTFIGALAHFEEAFGPQLWGKGLAYGQLSELQLRNKKTWDLVRTNVLNNGNNQLRAAIQEIAEYTVEWNRHTLLLDDLDKLRADDIYPTKLERKDD